ncbi:hypothetical protein B0I37DRAFT_423913 [Chaetomium sp. MPI-CAGE-AT-0009]|nr:hypothetical protein B0I37DRAFT_423913 [Chaetomium sp. MPI-CAGE-AT-0009]
MSKPPHPAALRYRAEPALIAIAYIAVLVTPWVLACLLSSRTVRQDEVDSGAVSRETAQQLHQVSFVIDALNFVAALAALPVIYALFARAAVVFSQRTSSHKTLNVKQLFALADRDFLGSGPIEKYGTRGFYFLFRATLVLLGLAVEKTRHALINAFPTEWTATAWNDRAQSRRGRYFASSLARDTTTGMYRQHALRMNSSSTCDEIPAAEFPVPCPRFATSYDNANLTVRICTMYITESSRRYSNRTLRCVGDTSMGYFELGNSFNGGKFGPLLSSFRLSGRSTRREFTDNVRRPKYPLDSYLLDDGIDPLWDYGTEIPSPGGGLRGPLALAAHAMFGAGSFFELAQSITEPNDTLSQNLCQLSPIPFQRTDKYLARCDPQDTSTNWFTVSDLPTPGRFADPDGWANGRVDALISVIYETSNKSTGVIAAAMYLANKATLEVAAGPGSRGFRRWTVEPNQIWRAEGIAIRTHVMSTVGLAVVSMLLGLQVAGILALVCYIYSVPTWTATLNAMAVARITRQLADRDERFLRSDSLWKPTPEEFRQMENTDALVGLVEHTHLGRPADDAMSPRASEELTLTADDSADVGYVLSVGAPGLISPSGFVALVLQYFK